jgi:hypothetical protein
MSPNTGTVPATVNNFSQEHEALIEQTYAYLAAATAITLPAVRALKIAGLNEEVGDRRTDIFKLKLPFQSAQEGLKKIIDALPAPEGEPKVKSDLVYSPELARENAEDLTKLRKYLAETIAPLLEGLQSGDVEPTVEVRQTLLEARARVMAVNKVTSFIFDALKPEKPVKAEESAETAEESTADDDGAI